MKKTKEGRRVAKAGRRSRGRAAAVVRKPIPASGGRIALISMAVMVIVAVLLLAVENWHYLRKAEELTYFAFTIDWLADCFKLPASLVQWTAVMLTQFLHFPWLGTIVLVALLVILSLLTRKAFGLKGVWVPLALVPAVMMLWAAVNLGYAIYLMKTHGYVFIGPVGCCASLLLMMGMPRKQCWKGCAWMLLTATVGYVLAGAYALMALTMMAVKLAFSKEGSPSRWIVAGVAVAAGLLAPWFMAGWLYPGLMHSGIYTWGIPRLALLDKVTWWPYIICGAWMLLASTGVFRPEPRRWRLGATVAVCGYACALALLLTCRYHDVNFSRALEMECRMSQGDWEGAVEAAKKGEGKPTRLVCMLFQTALNQTGTAGDRLFTIPQSSEPYNSRGVIKGTREVGVRMVDFHLGRINECYRWCMEDFVEYGPRVEYLKYMTRCALANGEIKLAKRYINKLEATWFHRSWARHYRELADNPELIDKDLEFQQLKPLMVYSDYIGGDDGLVEAYLLSVLSSLRGGSPEAVDRSIQACLLRKDIANFWPRVMLYHTDHPRLPRHYQEAVILFSALENQVDFQQFNLDPALVKRFESFIQMAQKYGNDDLKANYDIFYPAFGDTYWFYYFFSLDLTTT